MGSLAFSTTTMGSHMAKEHEVATDTDMAIVLCVRFRVTGCRV